MWIRGDGLKFSGAAVRIELREPFYVGFGVCSHNAETTEKAVFSNVELSTNLPATSGTPTVVQHARDHVTPLDRSPGGVRHAHADRGAQLAARRPDVDLQQRGSDLPDPGHRRSARGDRHRLRHALQQRPRALARRQAAGDQRPVAGPAPVAHLHAARDRREAHARSRRRAPPTGTAGRPTARRSPIAPIAAASSTSTRSPSRAAPRRG